jgi:hypothetical protein
MVWQKGMDAPRLADARGGDAAVQAFGEARGAGARAPAAEEERVAGRGASAPNEPGPAPVAIAESPADDALADRHEAVLPPAFATKTTPHSA